MPFHKTLCPLHKLTHDNSMSKEKLSSFYIWETEKFDTLAKVTQQVGAETMIETQAAWL